MIKVEARKRSVRSAANRELVWHDLIFEVAPDSKKKAKLSDLPESKVIDLIGQPGTRVEGEVRLSDGYGEHYIILRPKYGFPPLEHQSKEPANKAGERTQAQLALDILAGAIAAHEGGTTVMLGYDDATFEYVMSVKNSKRYGHGKGLIGAILDFGEKEKASERV